MEKRLKVPKPFRPLFWYLQGEETSPYRYYALSGGRSSGKSTTAAISILLRCSMTCTRVLCAREFQNSITESVQRLLVDLIDGYGLAGFTVTRDEIRHDNGSVIMFKGLHNNEQTIKSTEGVDICWVEEAQTITKPSLETLIPTIRKEGSYLIFTWNPLTEDDPVMRRFVSSPTPGDKAMTYYCHTTYKDMEAVGLLNDTIRLQVEAAEGSPEFAHTWLGRPYNTTNNQIISRTELDAALTDTPPSDASHVLGVDIARYGNDRTAMADCWGNVVWRVDSWRHASIPETARRVKAYAVEVNATAVHVDDTGVGGGVTDLLREWGVPVVGVNFAQKAVEPRKYPNANSEMWFNFAGSISRRELNLNAAMPQLEDLCAELTGRGWKLDAQGRRAVESKSDFKAVAGASPDLADAVLLSAYRPPRMPSWNVVV